MGQKNFKIDLHIHTPASRDFKGDKSENGYENILKEAKEAELDLICFTDHFSVNGFRCFQEKKSKILETIDNLRTLDIFGQNNLEQAEKLRKTYTAVKVIMGVEIKVEPGIHYLVIFNENINCDQVDRYLYDLVGNDDEAKKCIGDPKYSVALTSLQFFSKTNEAFGDDALIIGAHVDSSSGIITTLKDCGDSRLKILASPLLKAIEFNKLETREYVRKNLLPEVKRNKMAFIQNSDYHGKKGEKLGSFYFTLENNDYKLNYDFIKKELENTNGIVTATDTARERYETIIKNEKKFNFKFEKLDLNLHEEELAKTISAVSNSERGLIEFKINLNELESEKEIIEQFSKLLQDFTDSFLDGRIKKFAISYFNFTKGSIILILELLKIKDLVLYKGISYIIKNDEINIASSKEIQSIVARKMFYKFGRRGEMVLSRVNENAKRLKNNLLSYAIAYKIENDLNRFENLEIKKINFKDHSEEIEDLLLKFSGLGSSKGNYSIIDFESDSLKGGRFNKNYLRISLPIYNVKNLASEVEENEIKKGDIIVLPGGGCHLASKNLKLITNCIGLILKIPKEIDPNIIIAYLKSSFFQWYLSKIYNHNDIFEWIYSYREDGFPILKEIKKINEISQKIENLVLEEKTFLKNMEKKKYSDSEITNKINRHNSKGDKVLREIDEIIFKKLELDEHEIEEVYKSLKNLDVYDYSALAQIEESKSKDIK